LTGPRNIPEHGLLLGYNMFRGAKKAIRLADNDRQRHMYLVGQTGTGKSTFLENLALQDMLEGKASLS
jgi:putative ribosome biogenesis GTPase RsgA